MFTQILVPIDLSQREHLPQLREAARLLIDGQGSITLLYVDPALTHRAKSINQLGENQYAEHEKETEDQLQRISESLQLEDTPPKVVIREGVPHDKILELASEISADAILMMARRPGLSSYFIGSTTERVVRHADCSVVVLRH